MTSNDAIMQLAALTQRAREAGGDAAVANQVLAQVQPLANDASLAPSRELAAALINAASALIPAAAPGEVEALFGQAQRVLNASSDALVDDQLMLWHNLGILYDRYSATDHRDPVLARILQAAERYDGPLQRYGADVFLEQALSYRRLGKTEPMLTLLRQVHRYRSGADQAPADKVSWLEIYASLLLDGGSIDTALPVLAQGIELAHELGQSGREVSLLLSRTRAALEHDDLAAALAALERARGLVEQPALVATRHAASVWLNLAVVLLRQRATGRYAEARALCERAIEALRALGLAETDDLGFALYHRAVLTEYLGDWTGAARGYLAAAKVPGVRTEDAAEWLSLAGRAWFEAGEFDAAGDCYFDAVRRRVAAPSAAS
jgi:tetratricopeptide (TPR) repeat protein